MARSSRLVALLLSSLCALAAACSSPSRSTGTQMPSEMLGPDGSAPAAAGDGSAASAAPATGDGATTGVARGDGSAAAGPLTADEQALVAELSALMKEVQAQFERTVAALEQAAGDCKKAAAALSAPEAGAAALEAKMAAFKEKLGRGSQPSSALLGKLREVTLAAFPADTRARAEVVVEATDKKCAGDADFQRAKQAAGSRAAIAP